MDLILAVAIILSLAIVLLLVSQRFRIPSIVSFLVVGVLVGPYGFSVITDQPTIETIGQIGVILLLFTIGLEFSFEKLLRAWRTVIFGGIIQVCTTIAAIAAITYLLGFSFNEAVFLGFLVSLSSTAIVMKVLQERGEVESLPGRTMLGILIFQDLAIIPMILITPLLIGESALTSYESLPVHIAKVAGIIVILVVAARWVVPEFMYRVALQKNRELSLFTIAGICFITAWLTNSAGLSITLGAFLAGLIIGESVYSIDALSSIIPFRDIFAGIFFMSIGMLLDTRLFVDEFWIVLTVILVIILVKSFTGAFTAGVLGLPLKVRVFTGLSLAQIGEFSFVLAVTGLGSGLIETATYQIFLAGAIVTMALTPFSIKAAPGVVDLLYRFRRWRGSHLPPDPESEEREKGLSDHLVIAGYGITGKSVARAAEIAGIPYRAIDLNPGIVREEKESRHTEVIYGDAVQEEVLRHAGLRAARALVIVISDQDAIPRIIRAARGISPSVSIITRTRYLGDVEKLLEAGADEVIPEEFEVALGIFARILAMYMVS
ncbi:MAG: cation:proton antiporter, partial [Methanoregulaceae archaeon]|nr:cation:proton antiporter [Methanoregulaceae archaeon]